MSPALLQPLALFALLALALPVLIHLTRRSEQRPTPFAALRWLDARVRPRRRLRLHELLLLLLRLMMVGLAVFLLARPVWSGAGGAGTRYVAVAPGVDAAAARAALPDAAADSHWLAPGFPGLDEAPPASAPISSLLRELDARLPATTALTVLVPEELSGLDGERAALSRSVDWRVLPGRARDTAQALASTPIRLAVRFGPERAPAVRYLRAAVASWNAREPGRYTLDAAPADAPLPGAGDRLFWLGGAATPALDAWIASGGVAVIEADDKSEGAPLWRDDAGTVLARGAAQGKGRRVALTRALDPASLPELLDPDFPERLHALYTGPSAPPQRAPAAAIAPSAGNGAVAPLAEPLDPALALVLALLFALERVLATGTRLRTPA